MDDEITHIKYLRGRTEKDIEAEKDELREVLECLGFQVRSQTVEEHRWWSKVLVTRAELPNSNRMWVDDSKEFNPLELFYGIPKIRKNPHKDIDPERVRRSKEIEKLWDKHFKEIKNNGRHSDH